MSLRSESNPWPEIIGPCYTDDSLCRELGVNKRWLGDAARRLRVLRIVTADGIDLYPAFQVQEHRVMPGLEDVLGELAKGSTSSPMWAQWLNRPAKRPGGETRRRIDELSAGHLDALIDEARHTAAAWLGYPPTTAPNEVEFRAFAGGTDGDGDIELQ